MSYLWYWPDGGWSFDKWKAAQSWKPIKSEQSGKAELAPLTDFAKQKDHWQQVSDQILGELADKPSGQMRFEMLGEELLRPGDRAYSMQRIRYTLTDSEWGYAWLMQPKDRKPKGAMIALHQTHEAGKSEVVGFEKVPGMFEGMNYGAELADEGFIVLAPDAIAFGERQSADPHAVYHSADEFFAAQPNGSVMGKMAFDTNRACDLLKMLPQTKDLRIGCLGHSHGAYGTLFAMVNDERIEAGVISCGMNLLRKDPGPQRWWRNTALMPRLGLYEGDVNETPIDFHVWLAMLAPRPVLVTAGTQDQIFPNCDALRPGLKMVAEVYREQNAAGNFHTHVFDGGHGFPAEIRREGYDLLASSLKT